MAPNHDREIAEARTLLAQREAAMGSLLDDFVGSRITRVAYGEYPELPGFITEFAGVHVLDGGVELTLDDKRVLHAAWESPPYFHLSMAAAKLDMPTRDFTAHPAWQPFLDVPIANVTIQRQELMSVHGTTLNAPMDATFRFHDGSLLVLSARSYEPGPPESADRDADAVLVTFGREKARQLGIMPSA